MIKKSVDHHESEHAPFHGPVVIISWLFTDATLISTRLLALLPLLSNTSWKSLFVAVERVALSPSQ